MLTNLWGDGLPLWPATRERVDWILRGTALPRDARARQVSAARRRDHGGDLRDRARHGGRPAGIPAGADRRGRSVSRSRVEQRAAAGGLRQRRSRSSSSTVRSRSRSGSTRASAASVRIRSVRRAPASAARCACCSRTSAARCPASARWPIYGGHALHQRGVRRGRGEPARRAGCRTAPSGTASRRAPTRSRSSSPTAPPTSAGAARRRRRPKRTRCRACTAWRTSCACPTWPASPATSTARPAS